MSSPVETESESFPWEQRLAEARALAGTEAKNAAHISLFTEENIRHFTTGSGDDNPLFVDGDYAKKAGYPSVLAPPTMIFAHNRGQADGYLYDMWRFASRWELEWYSRLRPGVHLHSKGRLTGADLKTRRNGGKLIAQYSETEYLDQNESLVAKVRGTCLRLPKEKGKGGLGYEPRQHEYTAAEIEAIEQDIMAERRRGSEPVAENPPSEGELLVPVVKGPITEVDLAYWYGAYNPLAFGGFPLELKVKMRQEAFQDAWGDQAAAKTSSEGAADAGMPNRWFSGPGIVTWFGHLLTNWMGDRGFLRSLDVRAVQPAVLGDTEWCRGEVTEIIGNPAGQSGSARVRLWANNQLDAQVATGEAVVEWL